MINPQITVVMVTSFSQSDGSQCEMEFYPIVLQLHVIIDIVPSNIHSATLTDDSMAFSATDST